MTLAPQHVPLDRLAGQLFMAGFHGTEPSAAIARLIEREQIGGVILFSRNMRSAHQTLALTTELQRLARAAGHPYPLLIATDQENGVVHRLSPDATLFPGNMALGAVADEQMTFAVAHATARELRALGINMNLAPVADVNNDPANPVIGVRSFGEDPAFVAAHTAAAVRGYREGGVIPTLKHFPGHGDTAIDSHLGLPVIPFELERQEHVELMPFRAGLTAGAECVMTSHVALPRLTGGVPVPASLAPEIVRGLLRERLAFNGLAVTDSLEMRAIADTVGITEGAVRALAAGNDLVLISHLLQQQLAGLDAVHHALSHGRLSPYAMRASVARTHELKRRHLAWDTLPDVSSLSEVGSAEHRELASRAYRRSTTLIRDDDALVPLRLAPSERMLVILPAGATLTQAIDSLLDREALAASLRVRHPHADLVRADLVDLDTALARAEVVILLTINARLDAAQVELARRICARVPRVIGLAAAGPYDAGAIPGIHTWIATYEYSMPALATAIAALFGEFAPAGCLPVTLEPGPV